MGKVRSENRAAKGPGRKAEKVLHSNSTLVKSKRPTKSPSTLLTEAATYLAQGQADLALPLAKTAITSLESLEPSDHDIPVSSAVCLLGAIQLELGDATCSREAYARAAALDPRGETISADAFLNLAQLSDEGGRETVDYYEKALQILRNEIADLDAGSVLQVQQLDKTVRKALLQEKKERISDALCAMAEVYMTDLSWEEDAEKHCETHVTEALAICPESICALQTLANIRISQERMDDARAALRRSMSLWVRKHATDADDEEEQDLTPDFATRISLVRLLLEVDMQAEALQVVDRLVKEDDQSVEAWYLGGWGLILAAERRSDASTRSKEAALEFLLNALRLYRTLEYEDERLKDHALELSAKLKKDLRQSSDADEDWEDEQEDDDDDDNEPDLGEFEEIQTNGHAHDGEMDVT